MSHQKGLCTIINTWKGNGKLGSHPVKAVARPASASPATGSAASHRIEQEKLMSAAFGVTSN